MRPLHLFSKWLIAAFAVVLWNGCEPSELKLNFVLPQNYHGYIFLVQDLSQNDELIKDHGNIQIVVPANGVVLSKNLLPGGYGPRLSAVDQEGKRIQTEIEDNANTNRLILFALSSQISQKGDEKLVYDVFLVGTLAESMNYLNNDAERNHATEELRIRLKSVKVSP